MSAVRRDRQDLLQYEDSRGGGVFVQTKVDIVGVCQVSIDRRWNSLGKIRHCRKNISIYVAAYYHPNDKKTKSVLKGWRSPYQRFAQNQQPHLDRW